MFYRLFCIFILTYGLSVVKISAQNDIKWEDNKPKVKIVPKGDFSKIPRPSLSYSKQAPKGSTANLVAVDGYLFKWRPNWNFVGLGGDLLVYVRQSNDKSAIGIVETLPQKGAPSSSIIVLINLFNRQVVNYVVIPGKNVRKFCFVPHTSKIVCLVKSPYNKYYPEPEFQLSILDTQTGDIIVSSPLFEETISSICVSPDGSKLFATSTDSDKIRIYDINDLNSFKTVDTVSDPKDMQLSSNAKHLVVAGSEKVQIFDIQQEFIQEKIIDIPAFFDSEKLVLCSDDGEKFLLSRLGEATYYYNGKRFKKLCKITDNDIGWDKMASRILIGSPLKSTVLIFNPEKLDSPEYEFKFQKIRPRTDGKLYRIIPLPKGDGILLLDRRGALSRIYKVKHRWKKEIIINEPKP
jgi:hypothetical protein